MGGLEEELSNNLQGPALELGSYLQPMAITFRSRSEQGLAWSSGAQVAAGRMDCLRASQEAGG